MKLVLPHASLPCLLLLVMTADNSLDSDQARQYVGLDLDPDGIPERTF